MKDSQANGTQVLKESTGVNRGRSVKGSSPSTLFDQPTFGGFYQGPGQYDPNGILNSDNANSNFNASFKRAQI